MLAATMKFSAAFLTAVYASGVTSLPTSGESDQHFVALPEWKIQVFPGSELQTFHGSLESVYKEVLALNPSHVEDFKDFVPDAKSTGTDEIEALIERDMQRLSKRDPSGDPVCWMNDLASLGRFQDGTIYLTRMNAWLSVQPRQCSRISCSWSAGIAICNDNWDVVWSLHTSLIVHYVNLISRKCSFWGDSMMGGQQFDQAGFNVLAVNIDCNSNPIWPV
ncbi:hypothetical protein HJFPF1_07584 [Paramyrothecium foliicola]|nr:hypothetical protein HJFPF1_07584 [Paramyrothecium foliicola]